MESQYSIIMTTCPSIEIAKGIIDGLLNKKLAACIQSLDIKSNYFWQGSINEDKEVLLLIKTKKELYNEIQEFIKDNHSYEIPEIIEVPITSGFLGYLNWIDEVTKK